MNTLYTISNLILANLILPRFETSYAYILTKN